MKTRLLLVALCCLLFCITTANQLVNHTFLTSDDSVDFVFVFLGEPTSVATRSEDYGRYLTIEVAGEVKDNQDIVRFVGYSPIVSFRASSGKNTIQIRFDMLFPRSPKVEVVANTLRISFPRSSAFFEELATYTDPLHGGARPPLVSLLAQLRRYLDINLIIDEASVGNLTGQFVILSERVRAEDFFLHLIMNNPDIGYAFLPNNTLYIARKQHIPEKVRAVMVETNLSPERTTAYWASYTLNLKTDSELYRAYQTRTTQVQEGIAFNLSGLESFILTNFSKFTKIPQATLAANFITLLRGRGAEDEISIGVMLFGEDSLHERFRYFLGFLEGIETATLGPDGRPVIRTEEDKVFERRISYVPLQHQEIRTLLDFFTVETKRLSLQNEVMPPFDKITFEVDSLKSEVFLYGDESSVMKLMLYINDYIKNRKDRGHERMVRFHVADGTGKLLAVALQRIFPLSFIQCEGFNPKALAGKPSTTWTAEDVRTLQSFNGSPDEISFMGSNYEVQTVQKIADDWGLLIPPLQSEVRMITLSDRFPQNARQVLIDPNIPNSLASKFPMVQIDAGFDPILILKGKPQDLDAIEAYLQQLETVWYSQPEYVEVINVSREMMQREAERFTGTQITEIQVVGLTTVGTRTAEEPTQQELQGLLLRELASGTEDQQTRIERMLGQTDVVSQALMAGQSDTALYLARRWPGLDVFAVYNLNLFIIRGTSQNDVLAAKQELQRIDSEIERIEIYSQMVFFDYLQQNDIILIWENFYKHREVNMIYISTLDVYKVYGERRGVEAFIQELQELDVQRVAGRPQPITELVRINITTLTPEEVQRLVQLKVPGVSVEPFGPGGYYLTGTPDDLGRAKVVLNSLSSDFMEDSTILQRARGIAFETVQNVLSLYFKSVGGTQDAEIQLLDFENGQFLIKAQKEHLDQAKLILRSFGLIDVLEGMESEQVHVFSYKDIQQANPETWNVFEVTSILMAKYPTLKITHLEDSKSLLIVGSQSLIDNAVAEISQYKPSTVSEIYTYIQNPFPFFDAKQGRRLSTQAMISELLRLGVIARELDPSGFQASLSIEGPAHAVEKAMELLRSSYRPIIVNKETQTFDIMANGQDVIELTKEIAANLSPQKNIFLPHEEYTYYAASEYESSCRLRLEGVTWEGWLDLIKRLYDFHVEQVDGLVHDIYIIAPAGVTHTSGMNKTRTLRLSHGFEEISNMLTSVYKAEVFVDQINGILIFTNVTDAQMASIRSSGLVEQLAGPRKLVEISALVIDDTFTKSFSNDSSLSLSSGDGFLEVDGTGLSLTSGIVEFADFSRFLTALTRDLQVDLHLKQSQGNTIGNQISNPSITTMSGKEANIHIGDTYYFLVYVPQPDGTSREQFVTITPGYDLTITPHVRNDGTVHMTIFVKVSTSEPSQYGFPMEHTREARTEVVIRNNDTLVIGGLTAESVSKTVTKLPFFGDLPFVGQFFTRENDNRQNTTVNIYITPRIIELDVPEVDPWSS